MAETLFDGVEYNECHYDDWRQVVDHVASFFTARQYATEEYFVYVKKDLTDNDAYMVIVPHIVLLHSAPEHGAIRNAFHFMKLKHPVEFGHMCNDPVHIVITFASKTSEEHLKSIERLAGMLMDDRFVENIFKMDSQKELQGYLEAYEAVQ